MTRRIIIINSLLVVLAAGFFFIYPAIRAAMDIRDPALQSPGVPCVAWRLYRNLTPRYAQWARQRVARGSAESMSIDDISGTEWPVFGSVFYLWAIENLQSAWDAGDHRSGVEPRVFARDAIVASSELVIDPKHASWVKKHWGEDYLHRENAFYRMLIMAALTSREKLLHDRFQMDMLRDQVETFAAELDSTKSGLVDDYPGQCFPGDVMAALMCIKRADSILGTDHSKFIQRALRGFTGTRSTPRGLPPYAAGSITGFPVSEARGCANSYFCLTAPELWPTQAKQWFDLYDALCWQHRITAAGYREYPRGVPHSDWTIDVDAGPVIAGHGVSASAFGVGASRKNGRFDRAYPLATEMLVTVGELPSGVLAVPRLLSNLSDAPLLGEAAILWQLTIQPESKFPLKTGARMPGYVYIVLSGLLCIGACLVLAATRQFRQAWRSPEPLVWRPGAQATVWTCLLVSAALALFGGHGLAATAALLGSFMLPVAKQKRPLESLEVNQPVLPQTDALSS